MSLSFSTIKKLIGAGLIALAGFLNFYLNIPAYTNIKNLKLAILDRKDAVEQKTELIKVLYRMPGRAKFLKEILEQKLGKVLIRRGDDIYDEDAKLSVSIATLSGISTLIHTGINISSHNTPVKTKGLISDYNLDPTAFSKEVLGAFKNELESSWLARCKVRSV